MASDKFFLIKIAVAELMNTKDRRKKEFGWTVDKNYLESEMGLEPTTVKQKLAITYQVRI